MSEVRAIQPDPVFRELSSAEFPKHRHYTKGAVDWQIAVWSREGEALSEPWLSRSFALPAKAFVCPIVVWYDTLR